MSSRSFRDHTCSSYLYHTAKQALASGVSVLPIRPDGSKQPSLSSWRKYQKHSASSREVEHWFGTGEAGLAFVTGAVSGNLEALDFDHFATFTAWVQSIKCDTLLARLYEYVSWGYLEATPSGGRHIAYRCDAIERNQKLAERLEHGNRRKTVIETRGEGGLIIVAPSRGRVHPSGKSYILLRGGVSSIRTITPYQRDLLLESTRCFNTISRPQPPVNAHQNKDVSTKSSQWRPGDFFNQQASWEDVLVPHGWQCVYSYNGVGYWCRPGKNGAGVSATTNYNGHDVLYVFSTSTRFEAGKGYTKFSAYAVLNHAGDFVAAARALAGEGYIPSSRGLTCSS